MSRKRKHDHDETDSDPEEGCSYARKVKRPRYKNHATPVCEWDPSQTLRLVPEAEDTLQLDPVDQQNFKEYGMLTYCYNKTQEKKYQTANCLTGQPQMTTMCRRDLTIWLLALHRKHRLSFQSLCLTYNILDRYLQRIPVEENTFKLLGITCLLLACKLVETLKRPKITQLLEDCSMVYLKEQVLQMEDHILRTLDFNMMAPTASFFLRHFFLKRRESDAMGARDLDKDNKTMTVARVLAELTMTDYLSTRFRPSLLAASCINVADRLLGNTERRAITGGYPQSMIHECQIIIGGIVFFTQDGFKSLLPADLRV